MRPPLSGYTSAVKAPVEPDILDYEDDEGGSDVVAWMTNLLVVGLTAVGILLLMWSTLLRPFRIPSGSMVPTLEIGDHIFVNMLSYGLHVPWPDFEHGNFLWMPIGTKELVGWREPARGDVVVFKYPPDPKLDYIKRIVALPGDTIEVRQNAIFLNGVEQARTHEGSYTFIDDGCRSQQQTRYSEDLDGYTHPVLNSRLMTIGDMAPRTVPEDHYFVMGDNRDNSADSRVWGFVPRSHLLGRAVTIWLSWDVCQGDIPHFGSFRGDRFATAIQ